MLLIDGNQGEGGGQILRSSLSLSAITGRPFRMQNIRAQRSKPGLRPQHLTAVRAVAAVCQAELQGDHLDSGTLEFHPQSKPVAGSYYFDVAQAAKGGSAGSVTLLFQALLWPLLFAPEPSQLTLAGGTHVPYSPPYHYLAEVALPVFARLGVQATAELKAWGWYPAGGGVMKAEIKPVTRLQTVPFAEPVVAQVQGVAAVTNLPAHIPHRMARRAHNLLVAAGLKETVQALRERGRAPGAGIFLWLPQAGFSSLGRKGLPAEKVAETAVSQLLAFLEKGVMFDKYLTDQLLVPLALGNGRTTFTTERLTHHTLTNAGLIKQWLEASIDIQGELDHPASITINGIGFSGD